MTDVSYEEYGLDRRILEDFLSLASQYRLAKSAYDINFSSIHAFRAKQPPDRRPSILCCIAYALGQVVPRHRRVNSHLVRWPRKRIAIYDFVDLAVPVDYVIAGRHAARQRIIRGIDRLSLDEIRQVLETWRREREQGVVPGHSPFVRWLFMLPRFVRRVVWHLWIEPSPKRRAALLGTCALSCVTNGRHSFGYSDSPRALYFDLCRISERPVVKNGKVTTAPIGCMVRTFDHRITDGYEAAEFMNDLVDFLEHFEERIAAPRPAVPPAAA
jgi:pyruvate/2-oxoglutarate dehydrogenase complex dihydrolipoamide acyltransferase (E2) component